MPDTLGGAPRINGRRLDVFHVVAGVLEFDPPNSLDSYVENFDVSLQEIRHAVMYCREKRCMADNPRLSCTGCSLKFADDALSFEHFLRECGTPTESTLPDGASVLQFEGGNVYLGSLEETISSKIYFVCRARTSISSIL